MKKKLLEVMFLSDKRKGVLLLLHDGAKEMEFLLQYLGTTRKALLPSIKVLEEHYLILHDRDTYELTTIGKFLVDDMVPILDKIELLDTEICS